MAKGLTDKEKRDEMVVLLEGMPEEDIEATLPLEDESLTVDEAMAAAVPIENEFYEEVTVMIEDWDPKTAEGKKYHKQLKKAHTKESKKQGYSAREDEALGMETGAEATKSQSEAARRDESLGDYGTRT